MEEVNTPTWNKKRIFIAIFLLILLAVGGYFFKTRILDKNLPQPEESIQKTSVKGEATGPDFKANIQEAVREKIINLKREVLGLDVIEIASSSPQVQKILNDIKSLEQYPVNQAKEFCRQIYEKICGGL
jgi:hypothetical protein